MRIRRIRKNKEKSYSKMHVSVCKETFVLFLAFPSPSFDSLPLSLSLHQLQEVVVDLYYKNSIREREGPGTITPFVFCDVTFYKFDQNIVKAKKGLSEICNPEGDRDVRFLFEPVEMPETPCMRASSNSPKYVAPS